MIGVAPKGFTGIDHDVRPAFYVPIAMFAAVQSGAGLQADALTRRDSRWLIVKGRLRSNATMAQARADVQQIAGNLEKAYPNTNQNLDFHGPHSARGVRERPRRRRHEHRPHAHDAGVRSLDRRLRQCRRAC